ncbi:MAG: hypothetical protein EOP84_20220, partial [Verrucomicrobiaceae bacterium]
MRKMGSPGTRRRRIFMALTCSVLLVVQVAHHARAEEKPYGAFISIPHYTQEESNWCWAAIGQMIIASSGNRITQRQIVKMAFGSTQNRINDLRGTIRIVELPNGKKSEEKPLSVILERTIGRTVMLADTQITPEEIETAIRNFIVVIPVIEYQRGASKIRHGIMVSGFKKTDSGFALLIHNSATGKSILIPRDSILPERQEIAEEGPGSEFPTDDRLTLYNDLKSGTIPGGLERTTYKWVATAICDLSGKNFPLAT